MLAQSIKYKIGGIRGWLVIKPVDEAARLADWDEAVTGLPRPDESTLEQWAAEWQAATGGELGLAKAEARRQANQLLDQAVNSHPAVAKYPDAERRSFERQEQEATAWLKDNAVPTPFIDAFLQNSQKWTGDKKGLCETIVNNSLNYLNIMALVASSREQAQTAIDACPNVEMLNEASKQIENQIKRLANMVLI